MKRSLLLLEKLGKKYDLSVFYAINVTEYELTFQGRFDSDLASDIAALLTDQPTLDTNGYLNWNSNLSRRKIRIVLT